MEAATGNTRKRGIPISFCEDGGVRTRSRKRIQILEENETTPKAVEIYELPCVSQTDFAGEDAENKCSWSSKRNGTTNKQVEPKSSSPAQINSHFRTSKPVRVDSKENEILQTPTPATPRHRDALSKKTPITPRHRVSVGGKAVTPKTPRTPSTPSLSTRSVYNEARKVFARTATLGALVGRHAERAELLNFISERVTNAQGGCLYVSGPPGTGKSALIDEVCSSFRGDQYVKQAYVNCMSIKSAVDVFYSIASELELSDDVFGQDPRSLLQGIFLEPKDQTSYLVVLDEMDQLLNLDLSLLYSLFEWAVKEPSRLILIGISNALDLTDRFLPKLKAQNLRPSLLPFLPYTAAEIASVISSRSRQLLSGKSAPSGDFTPFIHPAAIQLISKKVAAQTGDLRKAFDIALRAIDEVESETRTSFAKKIQEEAYTALPLAENMNLSSPSSAASNSPCRSTPKPTLTTRLEQLTPETAPRATLAHVVRVTSAAFGNGVLQRLRTLNLQQKAVLCALVAQEKSLREQSAVITPVGFAKRLNQSSPKQLPTTGSSTAPTIHQVFEFYWDLCTRDNTIHPLSGTEFRDVIGSLETLSLVSAADRKTGAYLTAPATPSRKGRGNSFVCTTAEERRISASVGIKDLETAIEGVGSGTLKKLLYST